ncbi:MAG: 4a-hydroxytetrahydrobiopterin dehydratase [Chitinophagaceae bacterium]|nr:4a-hydroxytetrahydrobiopterin dehydratase [Chitinophagaceae bacterium]
MLDNGVYNELEVREKLSNLKNWNLISGALQKDFLFKNFNQALAFIVQIGLLAEQADHHPEIINVYNKVQLRLNTHSVNGITQQDVDLAFEIERL